ncbi:MAG: hypothetical protein E7345_02890 [Clostridiales bacterium]|nr:hypothetical protein [Clostridiales bacterium]
MEKTKNQLSVEEMRNIVMTEDDVEHNERTLENLMSRNKKVEFMSVHTLGMSKIATIVSLVKNKLYGDPSIKEETANYVYEEIKSLLGLNDKGLINEPNIVENFSDVHSKSDMSKKILCEVIIELYKQGFFTKREMEVVKDQLNIMFGSLDENMQSLAD